MSFDKIKASSLSKRKKEVVIDGTDGPITFYANELTVTQKTALSVSYERNDDYFLHWVVAGITDQHGKHMSLEQARALPDEVIEKFLAACMEVSGGEDNKKKPKKKK